MKIGIVGGGALGLSLAYFLSKAGVEVTVFEGKNHAGGLLDNFEVDGAWIDKYYHCIMGSDADLLALVDELDLTDKVAFTQTKQGVYRDGRLYSMASGKDFLLFPPLTMVERVRLGMTILSALRINDWKKLEDVSVEDWLVGLGGRGAFDKLWKPLLKAKFDGGYQQTPATYIWSRLKRTTSSRAAAGKSDRMGYFIGSYKVFIDRLVERIERHGSSVRLGARVQELIVEDGQTVGVVVDGEAIRLDSVVVTTPLPILNRLVPEQYRAVIDVPPDGEYLGVVCGLLLLDRRLTPYYALNITDDSIPFTGVIETTNLIAPEHVGGNHLVYLPKYVTPESPYAQLSDEELRSVYVTNLKKMFPEFEESWIKHLFVFRERFVEPLHRIGRRRPVLPTATALPGLFVVNNGQIYPDLTNCQASVRHALAALPTLRAPRSTPAAPALAAAGV
jgi:protoporphyrinogen oxidase